MRAPATTVMLRRRMEILPGSGARERSTFLFHGRHRAPPFTTTVDSFSTAGTKEVRSIGHDRHVQRYSAERSRDYEAFVRAHGDAVLRFLRRRADPQTADDVFSETMLVVWRRFDEVPEDALPWLYVTARNCLRNAERSARRQQRVVARIITLDPPSETAPDATADPRENCLRAALARLSKTDAEVLRLWAWEELGPQEIAIIIGASVNAATIRLHRAKKKLRQQMEAVCPPVLAAPLEGGAR